MKEVVIVIPVHKPDLTKSELASFKQCYEVLGNYPIRLLAPEDLDIAVYQNAAHNPEVVRIDPNWLSNIRQYNKLKISKFFYNLFRDYEYLLTYELDAWVFRDELAYWCKEGYDYIGAPWFEIEGDFFSKKLISGGNSGFSLRRIPKCVEILKRVEKLLFLRRFWYRSKIQGIFKFEKQTWIESLFKIKFTSDFVGLLGIKKWYEDYFWSSYVASTFPDFSVAPPEVSMNFSFEIHPSVLFEKNGKKIPFGCHAWERYDPLFWERYIQK